MIWLGERRGYLTDYVTQLWVRATGRRVSIANASWLDGPVGRTALIGSEFFLEFAREHSLELNPGLGLIPDMGGLESRVCHIQRLSSGVVDFYQNTANYGIEAWSEWCGFFRPFGHALAILFSRRLQQLNVPLSSLDTSLGITSSISTLADPVTKAAIASTWVRTLVSNHKVLYAGAYSTCRVPGFDGVCVKVVFPLPNGNAIVIMRPTGNPDGSLTLASVGEGFGDPGFYFTVHRGDRAWARYVRTMRETIRVYEGDDQEARADHVLKIWGMTFLRIHYRLPVREKKAAFA